MAHLVIHVNMDNAAFTDNPDELLSILRVVNYHVTGKADTFGRLRDTNGNRVGYYEVTEEG